MPAIQESDGDRIPPHHEISSDVNNRQDNSEQTQVYADIQEPISLNLREDVITYAYADTKLSTIPEETVTSPIYSEVNGSEETDKSNDRNNDVNNTGIVENAIYVSSGPMLR